jgi:hypothetical protein
MREVQSQGQYRHVGVACQRAQTERTVVNECVDICGLSPTRGPVCAYFEEKEYKDGRG